MAVVCVVVPCRNEEKRIEACVNSILAFALPTGVELEVVVVDGASTDDSKSLILRIAAKDSRVKYQFNEAVTQAHAVNVAARTTRAEFLLWLGAHAEYPTDYLAKCLETMKRTNAMVVGGICITRSGGNSLGASIVQALTTHRFGIGGGEFRIGGPEHEVDTVPYALFRTCVFSSVGYLDERLVRAQDYEFNRRIGLAGGTIWQNPSIKCAYFNQSSFRAFLAKQFRLEAPYNAYLWYLAPYAFTPRHAVTAAFVLFLCLAVASPAVWASLGVFFALVGVVYLSLAFVASIQQAIRYRKPWLSFVLPFCFLSFHVVHGLGVWQGILRLLLGAAPVQRHSEPWRGAGITRLSKDHLIGKLAS